jgi:hypothetical protein
MNWNKFFNIFLATLLCVATGCFVAAVSRTILADGRVEYCYIEENRMVGLPVFELRAYRNWRQNTSLVTTRTFEEAVASAKMMGCKFGVRQ